VQLSLLLDATFGLSDGNLGNILLIVMLFEVFYLIPQLSLTQHLMLPAPRGN